VSKHYQPIPSNHPSGGSEARDTRPLCCARCRRGTLATGLGPCGYGDQGCPNVKCGCHKDPLREAISYAAEGLANALDRYVIDRLGTTNDQ